MRKVWRTVFALWLAGVFAVFGGVVVDAQNPPYEGAFFWMSAPGNHPGDLWIAPPFRALTEVGGDPWQQAMSFPSRVWESEIAGAPPNDACFGVGVDAVTDIDTGPYGLQTSQYFAEWWEGNVYFDHPAKPPGWSTAEYGFFNFAYRPPQNGFFRMAVAPGTGAFPISRSRAHTHRRHGHPLQTVPSAGLIERPQEKNRVDALR